MLSSEVKQKLDDAGARMSEVDSIERLIRTSAVFCFAKPHADKFPDVVLNGTMREATYCMAYLIEGLTGWKGDTAKEHKREVRRWIKRIQGRG